MVSVKNSTSGIVSDSSSSAMRTLAEQGGKGFAARAVLKENGAEGLVPEGVRPALKRIPSRKAATMSPAPDPAHSKDAAARQGERAVQALLGLLGDAAKNDGRLAERLGEMPDEDLQRLAKLMSAVNTPTGDAPHKEKPPLLDKVEQHLADHNIKLLVKAGSVTINIGGNGQAAGKSASSSSAAPYRRSRNSYNSWARRCARIRDFLMGH